MRAYVSKAMCVGMCVDVRRHVHGHANRHACRYVHSRVHTHVHMYLYAHVYTHVYTHVYMYIHGHACQASGDIVLQELRRLQVSYLSSSASQCWPLGSVGLGSVGPSPTQ